MERHENYEEITRPILRDDAGKNPKALIVAIRSGDADAFANYYLGYGDSLMKFLVRMLRNEDDASEIMQETFALLWERRETLDPHASLNGFVMGIARHLAMDMFREKRKAIEVTELHLVRSEYSDFADDEIIATELSLLIEIALVSMPAQRRKVFEMKREEGMTYNEIAKRLNITCGTVKTHMVLALKDIRSIVGTLIVILSSILING